jgi:Phytanoyl-CoA dioxygenase (PhyH)
MAGQMDTSSNDRSEHDFDEAWYLAKYPDVAAAVAKGVWKSGFEHFDRIGRQRGRLGSARRADGAVLTAAAATATDDDMAFEPEWYLRAYPLAAEEIGRGAVPDPYTHYQSVGRHRGYLPNRHAPRPENPTMWRSRFGGFWTDQANAMDLLAARLDLGSLTSDQGTLLGSLIRDGYAIIERAIPTHLLDRAEADFDRAYRGHLPQLLFNIHGIGHRIVWRPEALTNPAKALDLHWLSPAIRDLMFADAVLDFLHLVFERRAFATQTLGFWRGSAQQAHQDTAFVCYSQPTQFLASWIAMEDVVETAGELFYYSGSHRLSEFLYAGKYKGVEEARRLHTAIDFQREIDRHLAGIPAGSAALGAQKKRFLAKRGDVLIWSADLAHGGRPISGTTSRKSIVTHYCAAEAVPLYFETRPGRRLMRHGNEFYASGHYDFDALE